MADDMFFDIKVDGMDQVMHNLDDVIGFMDRAKKKLDDLSKSEDMVTAIGGDKNAIKKMKGNVSDFRKEWGKFSDQYKKQLEEHGKAISSAFGEDKVKELKLFEQSVSKGFQAVSSDVADLGEAAQITGKTLKDTLEQSFVDSEKSAQRMAKTIANSIATTTGAADRAGSFGSQISAQGEQLEKSRKIIENLEDDRAKLERGFKGSDIVSLMFAQYEPERVVKTVKELSVNTGALAIQQDSYRNKLATIYSQQKEIEEQFRNSNDPDVLIALQKAYDTLTERADRYVDKLQIANKLKRQGLGEEGGRGTGNATRLARTAEAVGQAAGLIGSLGDSMGLFNRQTSEFIASISEGGQAITESIKRMQDMRDTGEKWADSIAIWGKRIKEQNRNILDSGDKLSAMNKIQDKAAGATGFLSKGMGAMSAAMGVAGIAIQAITSIFSVLDTITGRSNEQIEKRIELISEQIEREKAINELIDEGSITSLRDKQKALRQELKLAKKQSALLEQQAYDNESFIDRARTGFSQLIGQGQLFGPTVDKMNEVNDQIRRLNNELGDLSEPTLSGAIARAKELNDTQDKAQEAIDSLKEKEQELYEVRVDAQKAVGEYTKQMAELDSDFGKESKKLLENREREDRKNLKEHLANLTDQETTYQENVEDMRQEHLADLADKETEYMKEVADAASEYNKAVADMGEEFRNDNTEADLAYQEENIERKVDYDKTLAKMEEDYNKDRIQRQKDLHQQLWEAELANDALQYFQLMKQGEKDAKEADDQHKDELTEAQESYKEESADRKKSYNDERADRLENYNKQRQELTQSFNEENKLRTEQYNESIKATKEEFAKTLELEKNNYMKERAEIVKNFEARKKEIEDARNEEDIARQQQLAEQRSALDKQLDLDLEYYQRRENLLLDFINGLESKTKGTKDILEKLSKNDFNFTGENRQTAVDAINQELKRMADSGGDFTDDELEQWRSYQSALQILQSDGAEQIKKNSDEYYALQEALVRYQNEQAASFSKTFDNRFKYEDDPTQLQYRETAEAAGKTAQQLPNIADTHQQFLDDMKLSYNQYGLTTEKEAKDQADRYQHIVEREGDENVSVLGDQVRKQNQIIVDANEQKQQELELAQDKEIATRQTHFYGVEDETAQHYMRDVSMREGQYSEQIKQTEDFGKELENTTGDVYEDALDAAESSITDGTDNIASAYDQVNQEIVAGVQRAATAVRNSFSRTPNLGGSNRQNAQESFADRIRHFAQTARDRLFAAEGAFVTKPTELIAGEGKSPELIMPFNPSAGIPNNIMQQFGQGFFNGLQTIKDNGSFGNRMPSNPQAAGMQDLSRAISKMSAGMEMQIGSLNVGSDISRSEIQSQLRVLMQAVVDTVAKQSQPR